MRIHVALVSAYPTEAEARNAIADDLHVIALAQFRGCPYLGIWTMPLPYGSTVHVFTEGPTERLEADGWTRDNA